MPEQRQEDLVPAAATGNAMSPVLSRIRDCRIEQLAAGEFSLVLEAEAGTGPVAGRARLRGEGLSMPGLAETARQLRGCSLFARHPLLEAQGPLIADAGLRVAVGACEAVRCDAAARAAGLSLAGWLGGALKPSLPVALQMPADAKADAPDGVRRVAVTSGSKAIGELVAGISAARAGGETELALHLAGQVQTGDLAALIAVGRKRGLAHIADPCGDAAAASHAFAGQLPTLALTAHRYDSAALRAALAAGGAQILLLDPVALGGPEATRALATLAELHGIEVGLTAAGGTPWQAHYAAAIAASLAAATEPLVVDAAAAPQLCLDRGRLTVSIRPGVEDVAPADPAPALQRATS